MSLTVLDNVITLSIQISYLIIGAVIIVIFMLYTRKR
jgi:hypothetical protein